MIEFLVVDAVFELDGWSGYRKAQQYRSGTPPHEQSDPKGKHSTPLTLIPLPRHTKHGVSKYEGGGALHSMFFPGQMLACFDRFAAIQSLFTLTDMHICIHICINMCVCMYACRYVCVYIQVYI